VVALDAIEVELQRWQICQVMVLAVVELGDVLERDTREMGGDKLSKGLGRGLPPRHIKHGEVSRDEFRGGWLSDHLCLSEGLSKLASEMSSAEYGTDS
jgi:hypothetical protein